MIDKKKCNTCNKIKTSQSFYKHSGNPDGYRYDCIQCKKQKDKKYRKNNKKKEIKRAREWQKRNPKKYKKIRKKSYHKHKEKRLKQQNEYKKKRRKNDDYYRIKINLRNRISKCLTRGGKSETTRELLGCSFKKFKEYLERQFTDEMSWNNYGSYWHIDHIKPCATFDLIDEKQRKECFHYENLRPLEKHKNLSRPKDGSDL